MADHMSKCSVIKYNIEDKEISKEARNGHLIVDSELDENEKFNAQQKILDFSMHSCDIS